MPRTPHPTLKTFEEFLTAMKKESEETQRYFFSQIQFAEKERARYRDKERRKRERLKAAPGTEDPAAPGTGI